MVPRDSTALVLADDGVREALIGRGVTLVEAAPADAVVVGWTRSFTFAAIDGAARAVREGARLIGTNEDPTYPTPDGLLPGAGALLAAVATAAETTPEVAGKPHRPTVDAIEARATDLRAMVGDRPSTDGALAAQLGVPFALVLSGVTEASETPTDPAPATVARDLATLVRTVLE
jgi:4-nitrophenyl phosphatase